MFGKQRSDLICPFCFARVVGLSALDTCPVCSTALPLRYVETHRERPPIFVQVFGRTQVGKTVYLNALTYMLWRMIRIWGRDGNNYTLEPIGDRSQDMLSNVKAFQATGKLPPSTSAKTTYMMSLANMQRWGNRTLTMYDAPGELYHESTVSLQDAPFVRYAPTTFMFISLTDNDDAGTMDDLFGTYTNTLINARVDFKRERRSIVVVLTKADRIPDLPPHLRAYLTGDPLGNAVRDDADPVTFGPVALSEYIETMARVSDSIQRWIQRRDVGAQHFIGRAANLRIPVRFALVSSTSEDVQAMGYAPAELRPYRVLDPYFWSLELNSH